MQSGNVDLFHADCPWLPIFETDFHKACQIMPAHTVSLSNGTTMASAVSVFMVPLTAMLLKGPHLLNRPLDQCIISCHLGGSSSITAIKERQVHRSKYGFFRSGGVAMATRCGDIDPFIIPYIMKKTGLNFEEVISTWPAKRPAGDIWC